MRRCMECNREMEENMMPPLCIKCYWQIDAGFDRSYGKCYIIRCNNQAIAPPHYARHIVHDLCGIHMRTYYARAMRMIRRWYGT